MKMKKEDLESSVKILSALRITISNIRLYPADSSIVKDSIADVFGRLQNNIQKYGQITFAEVMENILINGNLLKRHLRQIIPHDVYESFVQTLIQSHIKSLSFKRGLTLEQFSFFLKIFSEKHWRREGDMMVLSTILKERNINTIGLNEKIYRAVGEGDIVLDQGMDYLERKEGALDTLMRSIEEVVEMSIFDEKGQLKDNVRRNIVNKILNLKPDILVKYFERKKEPAVEEVKQKIVEGLPPHHIKEIVAKVVGVYKEIKENAPAGSKKEEELLKLKETINSLLSSCRDRDTTIAIFNELKNENIQELLPPWWNKPEKTQAGLMVTKARLLLEKDALELLAPDVQNELGGIVKEMESIGKEDIVKGLLEKLKENLQARTAATRMDAAKLYCKIKPVLTSLSSEFAYYLDGIIWKMAEVETDTRVYSQVAVILIDSVREAVKEYDYEKAEQILAMFRKHRYLENEGFTGRSSHAADVLNKVARSDTLGLLVNDLRSRDHLRQVNAYRVLIQMEEFITPGIIDAIKKIEDLGLREIMASVTRKTGRSAVLSLISELEKDLPAVPLIRIIEVLPTLGSDSLCFKKLYHTVNHHDPRVRVQTLKTALLLEGDKKNLFRYALDDDNLEVRNRTIQSLGELGDKELFSRMAKKKKTVIEERLFCEALGKINLKECTKYLMKVAGDYKFWQKKHPREVKIAAIRALEHYPTGVVVKFLEKRLKCKDRYISSNAEYVLEKIKNNEIS